MSDPLGIVAGFPECRRLPLEVEQCCPVGCYRSLEFGNDSFKPAWVLPPSLAKGVHGRVVNGDMDVVPSFFSTSCGAVAEGLLNRVGEVLAQVWDCCPSCVDV